MRETTRQAWDAYWQHYERPDYVHYIPEIVNTIRAHVEPAQLRALEIGVGTGGTSSLLARHGAQVTTLDFSVLALVRTRLTAQHCRVCMSCVLADAYELPFPSAYFDLVFHQGFLEHFRDVIPLLREQRRVLHKSGLLLVDVPQLYSLYTIYKRFLVKRKRWPYGDWEREFSYTELCGLLEANGFSIVTAYGRGYFPRPFAMLHNLPNAEMKVLKRRIIPERWWDPYRRLWSYFERSKLGVNTLQCVGILARAV